MKLITEREQIESIVARWQYQYRNSTDKDQANTLSKLVELDLSTATRHDVAKVIGNSSWIGDSCASCKKHVVNILVIGDLVDSYNYIYLCESCVKKAASLFDNS